MIRRVLTLSLFAVAACQEPAKSCTADDECGAGARCIEELCVLSTGGSGGGGTAGGRAGGTAGGSSGGSSGGGTSGGMSGGTAGGTAGGTSGGTGGGTAGGVGGGSAGGNPALCDGGCVAEWQACIDNNRGGQCEAGIVELRAPTAGETYAAATNVTVSATLLTPDGGSPWPTAVMIPLATTWGRSGTVQSGMPFVTPGAADSGTGDVAVGWTDGGPAVVSRMVVFTSCNGVACQPYQRCEPTVGGGRCDAQAMTVSWVLPGDNSLVRGPVNPSFIAEVQVDADAGAVFPGSVPVAFDGGVWSLSRVGSTVPALYRNSTVTLTAGLAGADGAKVFVAGWPASGVAALSANRTVTWDGTAPTLTVTVEDAPARNPAELDSASTGTRVYKKDEVAKLRVESSEDIAFAAVVVAGGAGPLDAGQCTACGNASRCRCYGVDLASTSLAAMRGTVGFSFSNATDAIGNTSQTADGGIQVTRLKWRTTMPDGLSVRAAPALDSAGRLYVGTIDANNNGNVYQVGRRGEVSTFLSGSAVQSLAVAETAVLGGRQEVVYVASNTAAGGNLQGRALDGGVLAGSGASNCQGSYALEKTYSAIALFDAGIAPGAMEVGAAGMFRPGGGTGTGGALCVYRAFNGPAQLTEPTTMEWVAPTWGGTVVSPTNLVAVDNSVYLLQTNRSVRRFDWSGVFAAGPVGTPMGGLGIPVSMAATPQRLFAGFAGALEPLISTDRSGGQQVSYGNTGNFTSASPLVLGPATSSTTPSPAWVYAGNGASTGDWLQPVLASLSTNSVLMPGTATNTTAPGARQLQTAPVLGMPRSGAPSGDTLLYALREGGVLQVASVSAAGASTPEWNATLFMGAPNIYASPTLDCSRDAVGVGRSGPGTFFAVTGDGQVAAVIVDSSKLATDAAWPKWQRTAGNAGNPSFPLNPGCP